MVHRGCFSVFQIFLFFPSDSEITNYAEPDLEPKIKRDVDPGLVSDLKGTIM